MFLTAELVFTIFMLAAEKHEANFIAPIGIGLALFIAQMFGTYYTGSSLNPARTLGPAVVVHQFASYHWIYWVSNPSRPNSACESMAGTTSFCFRPKSSSYTGWSGAWCIVGGRVLQDYQRSRVRNREYGERIHGH